MINTRRILLLTVNCLLALPFLPAADKADPQDRTNVAAQGDDVGKTEKKRVPLDEAVDLAGQYLGAGPQRRSVLKCKLDVAPRMIGKIMRRLAALNANQYHKPTPNFKAQHFQAPGLRKMYEDDLLYFWVPRQYDGTKPFGLLILMHGGGKAPATSRQYAVKIIMDPARSRKSYGMFRYFEKAPFITVAPSAPWNEKSTARWNLPEADDYISAVIEECRFRFNLDIDRVFLGGHSMGGFGAYHLCQRLCDRIAGGFLSAGSWRVSCWRSMTGTPLYIAHGRNDAFGPTATTGKGRPRFTDVFFARAAHRLLEQYGVRHVYVEYDGGHSPYDAHEALKGLIPWMMKNRRHAYAPHIVAVSPRGTWLTRRVTATSHSRWISILEIGDGRIEYDMVKRTGPPPKWGESMESFQAQGFKMVKKPIRAGIVDARNLGENTFEITTDNVTRFSLWLHPKMVDFTRPVTVKLNGRARKFSVKPTLVDALRSYERRRDWGLIYHCEVVIKVACAGD